MPGRGQPWKGVGKGNPDRIGTLAIADGSITETDLDTNVTDKLNTGGGGGAQLDFSCISDDFPARTIEAINEKYNIANGIFLQTIGSLYGVLELDSGSISTEGAGELTTQNTFVVNPNLGDVGFKVVNIVENLAQMHVLSLTENTMGSVTNQSSLEGASNDMIGFFVDPAQDNNWRAVCRSSGTSTIVDTGIARTLTRQKFEASFDKTAGEVTFTIGGDGGEVVATISTNIPVVPLFMDAYAVNVVATQRSLFIDFWQVDAERV